MKIYFESGGGFVGLTRFFESDSAHLPQQYLDVLMQLLAMPEANDSSFSPTTPYRLLKVDAPLRQIQMRFDDTPPEHLSALLDYFESQSIPLTRVKK